VSHARDHLDGPASLGLSGLPDRESPLTSASANRRGILAMLTAMTLFTVNDTLLKIATAALPPSEIMTIRGLFGLAIALTLVFAGGHARHLSELLTPVLAGRAALEALVAFSFITALRDLPIADITAILQAAPIIITLLAVTLGLERVGVRRWLAVVVGFVGVLLICKPSPAGLELPAALTLLAATLVAIRDLMTRYIAPHVPTIVVTLSATFSVTLLGLLMAFGESWQPLDLGQVLLLGSAALFVTLGNLAIIAAFRVGDIAVVSPYRYMVVPLSLLIGVMVFGDFPDVLALFGIALIVMSGLYTFYREQRLRVPRSTALSFAARTGEEP
jgi:drug/metabolite transporter (DMT)-like permease